MTPAQVVDAAILSVRNGYIRDWLRQPDRHEDLIRAVTSCDGMRITRPTIRDLRIAYEAMYRRAH
jgi:hypothetical protein